MIINQYNYEAFFLDYLEGRLDKQQTATLELFLESNPGLKAELEDIEMIILNPDTTIHFAFKQQMKKHVIVPFSVVNEMNFNDYFIAMAEGDLSEDEQSSVAQFLNLNPSLQKEYELIKQCRLKPNHTISYPSKQELKKKKLAFIPLRESFFIFAAAASVALLIGLFRIFDPIVVKEIPIAQSIEQTVLQPQENLVHKSVLAEVIADPVNKPIRHKKTPVIELPAIKRIRIPPISETFSPIRATSLQINSALANNQHARAIGNEMRQDVSRYYGDIAMAQNMRYYEPTLEDKARGSLLQKGSALVLGIFKPEDSQINLDPQRINWWEVADVGINGFSRLSSSSLTFSKETDQSGEVKTFALQSNSININRTAHRAKD
ncbi:MAG: hypothetical protein U1C46_02910 [Bacteroidales bacterium]|nr:hypothetical protein [Bacteroidales bacterium]MDZ4203749.1 hypothetical protein [Bacteroidales bacterium]